MVSHALLGLGAALQVCWLRDPWFTGCAWMPASAAALAATGYYSWAGWLQHGSRVFGATARFALAAMGAAAWIAGSFSPGALPKLLATVLPAALYLTPWRRRSGEPIGLRSIPFLKSFITAWVWASGTTGLSAAAEGEPLLEPLFMLPLMGGFYLALAIAFDLRDAQSDPPRLSTLPQVLGARGAKALAVACLLPLAAFLAFMAGLARWPAFDAGEAVDPAFALPLGGVAFMAAMVLRSAPGRAPWHWFLLDASVAAIPVLALLGSRM
jgi:hypothetical protein